MFIEKYDYWKNKIEPACLNVIFYEKMCYVTSKENKYKSLNIM